MSGWQAVTEDALKDLDDGADYVVLDRDDLMCVLAGRENYFRRAGARLFTKLPSLPEWYIDTCSSDPDGGGHFVDCGCDR